MYPDKFVNKPSDIPNVEHYAIFEGDSYYTEGDERSRTHPGHGYPATTTEFIKYEAYLSEEKLFKAIEDNEDSKYYNKEYRVCRIIPMKIKKNIRFTVE